MDQPLQHGNSERVRRRLDDIERQRLLRELADLEARAARSGNPTDQLLLRATRSCLAARWR